jgi:hypothetical protein
MRAFILLFTFLLFYSHPTWAQQSDVPKFREEFPFANIVKCNLLSPFMGTVNIHLERMNTINSSSQFEAFFFTGQVLGQPVDATGFGLTYNYRYYLTGSFPTGFYVQPFTRYQQYTNKQQSSSFSATTITDPERINTLGLGIVFGYQVVFFERVTFDLFGGPVYNKSYLDGKPATANDTGPFFNGGWMRLGTTFGFAF